MIQIALDLEIDHTVLDPIVRLKHDPDTLAIELGQQVHSKLGVSKKAIKRAIRYGLEKQRQFINDLYLEGGDIIKRLKSNEPVVIVTGRPYNLYDERLNLKLGHNLAKIGTTALPMDLLDVTTVDLTDFPSMYWGLGAQILRTAKLIKARPNYFGLHLTNFECGADSFLEHFYKYIMGDKPYLILELDEHSAVAGVMTRLEAFKNVIENSIQKSQYGLKSDRKVAN